MTRLWRRSIFLLGVCGWGAVQAQISVADIPLPVLDHGQYVHEAVVTTKVLSLETTGMVIECRAELPPRIWRECYTIADARLHLDSIIRPIAVPGDPTKTIWMEIKLGSSAKGPVPAAAVAPVAAGASVEALMAPAPPAAAAEPSTPEVRVITTRRSRPGIFQGIPVGALDLGVIDVDARWRNYSSYLRRVTEMVQISWDQATQSQGTHPKLGSVVKVSFGLNSKGEVSRIIEVKPSAGTSPEAAKACLAGIKAQATYGPWTDAMVADLGKEQAMTFVFCYY